MADTAEGKIIDAYKALLEAYGALSGETFFADRSPDDAFDEDNDLPCWVIFTEAWDFDQSEYQGQTRHDMLVNFERLETSANVGVVSRANQEKIAHVIAAIHSDRTLGGRLESSEELNVAPPAENGRGVGGASLQVRCVFYTPRGNHFTIVGQGGATF